VEKRRYKASVKLNASSNRVIKVKKLSSYRKGFMRKRALWKAVSAAEEFL
jgi:hypothetical protein